MSLFIEYINHKATIIYPVINYYCVKNHPPWNDSFTHKKKLYTHSNTANVQKTINSIPWNSTIISISIPLITCTQLNNAKIK